MTSTNIRAALQVVTAQPARTILLALPVAVSTGAGPRHLDHRCGTYGSCRGGGP